MKKVTFLLLAAAAAAGLPAGTAEGAAFAPTTTTTTIHRRIAPLGTTTKAPPSSLVAFARPDSSDAVAEAVRISEKYGATSKEARVAWDIVEEMDSSDTSPATDPPPSMSASESRKIDYLVEINGLSVLLEETSLARSRMRDLVSRLRDLELSDPSLSKLGAESEGLRRALQEAKAAIEVHGPGSADADAAWKNLEGCAEEHGGGECNADDYLGNDRYSAAALKAHHYYDAVVDPELLSESLDALDSVEALSKFVKVEKNRLNKL